jgi:hypothetical protein
VVAGGTITVSIDTSIWNRRLWAASGCEHGGVFGVGRGVMLGRVRLEGFGGGSRRGRERIRLKKVW